jgi:GrpB-like predicted nucleotidyltransferase (UPF0157 family)
VSQVEVVAARAAWVEELRSVARVLRAHLGEAALRIDHVGSTSVRGLDAKDVLDVQVTVAALDPARLAPLLDSAGFRRHATIAGDHRPPGADGPTDDWTKLLFNQAPGGRLTTIHVRAAGRPNQRYALLFRDYLRAHPHAAAAYGELKRRLAALGIDGRTYADVKDPACDLVMAAAEAWAAQTGWRAGPSDA